MFRNLLQVSQLLELQFRIPGSWANDARGAFSRNYIWPPWDQVCSSYISDLPNSAGAFRCSSQVERLQDIGSAMASQVFSNGSLLGGVTCSAMPGSPSAQRSSLSLLVPTSSSRNLSSVCYSSYLFVWFAFVFNALHGTWFDSAMVMFFSLRVTFSFCWPESVALFHMIL